MASLRFTRSEIAVICIAADWHRATAIDLIAKQRPGVERGIIEAAVEAAFENAADSRDDDPFDETADCVNDDPPAAE